MKKKKKKKKDLKIAEGVDTSLLKRNDLANLMLINQILINNKMYQAI